jgi:hypothetical protein
MELEGRHLALILEIGFSLLGITPEKFVLNFTLSGIASFLSTIFLSNLIEYLREFESICKTVLAHESGDPGVQFNEKTEGRKSRETVPLNHHRPLLFRK